MLDILGDVCYNGGDTQKPVGRAALGRSGPNIARVNPICKFFHSNYGLAKTQKNPETTGPPRQRGRRDPICDRIAYQLWPGTPGTSARIYDLPHQNFELSLSDFALAELVQKELQRVKNTSFDNFSTEIDF